MACGRQLRFRGDRKISIGPSWGYPTFLLMALLTFGTPTKAKSLIAHFKMQSKLVIKVLKNDQLKGHYWYLPICWGFFNRLLHQTSSRGLCGECLGIFASTYRWTKTYWQVELTRIRTRRMSQRVWRLGQSFSHLRNGPA